MTLAEEKQVQRKAGIAARRALAPETRAAANAALCARLAALPCFRQARTILLYAAFGGEADLATLADQRTDMKLLAERGVEIFFTQVFRDSFFHADMHPGNILVSTCLLYTSDAADE